MFVCAQGIQMTTRKRLCSIKGISEAKVDKIKVPSSNRITCQVACNPSLGFLAPFKAKVSYRKDVLTE